MQTDTEPDICALCGRKQPVSFHHLIPRTCHSNKWFKKHFTWDEMKHRGIEVCRDCHRFIHRQFTEKELGKCYNTRERLIQEREVQKFIRWVRKKK